MDHRSVSAAAAGGAIAIGPSPAPRRSIDADSRRNHDSQQQQPIIPVLVAVPSTISEKQQNILRFHTKSTPWSGAAELDAVGRGLLLAAALFPPQSVADEHGGCPLTPDELSELDYALRSVAVWRDRAEGGRLPHSVETSAALASALLEDANAHGLGGGPACYYHHRHGRPPSELSLRMSYSSAVMRATNGLADASVANRGLKKPGYGVSVAALCEQIGLPGWVVDMRHDAAHNELPSLPSLRLASKTLLGYLGDKYWSELVRLRAEAAAKAVGILDAYKASAKAAAVEHAARMNQQIAKAEAARVRASKNRERRELERADKKKQKEEVRSDDDDDFTEFGRFSIFADMSSSSSSSSNKKKGKKRPREESAAGSDDATTSNLKEEDAQKDEPAATKQSTDDSNKDATDDANFKPRKKKLASPLKLASQFIEEVPIDAGLQILLSYLVWGCVSDMPPEKGAMVPRSPTTIPETEQGFDKVKNRYVLLLAKVSTAYTGFLHALIVNLVDLILLIEERHAGSGDASIGADDDRKLFFLGGWVKYLVSREFHSHFDPHLGVFPRGKVDLTRKKVWKWTEAEKSFMADCAPFEALHRWKFPLNGLHERCTRSLSTDINGKVAELISLFKKAGRDHILDDNTEVAIVAKAQTGVEKKETAQEMSLPITHLKGDASGMSLEQMEAFLSDSDAEGDRGDKKKPGGDTQVRDVTGDGDAIRTKPKGDIAAWSQCNSWEPCAMGSLPGYPSYY